MAIQPCGSPATMVFKSKLIVAALVIAFGIITYSISTKRKAPTESSSTSRYVSDPVIQIHGPNHPHRILSLPTHTPVTNPTAIPLISQLSGELGSVLSYIANGRAYQLTLKNQYNIDTDLKFRHQQSMKLDSTHTSNRWMAPLSDIQMCFPKLARLELSYGNDHDFVESYHLLDEWLHTDTSMERLDKNSIEYLAKVARVDDVPNGISARSKYPLPFLYFNLRAHQRVIDEIYDDLRELFLFDEDKCCNKAPYHDENVFHFRDFCKEMKNCHGFQELSPYKVANELFAHLQPGDKVAIVTRDGNTDPYILEFQKRFIQARVVKFQHGHQAFCFLLHTQKELVGFTKSQFFEWAGLLGQAHKVRFYDVDTVEGRMRYNKMNGRTWWSPPVEFTHPVLKEKVRYEIYESEGMEESDLPRLDRGVVGNPFVSK